jgi:protein-disulfide isomerase
MTIRRTRTLSLAWIVLLGVGLASVAQAAGFSAEQRAEVVAILREAMRTDPSILRDAIAAMQDDETARERAAGKAALASAKGRLVDAADPIGGNPNGDVTIVEFFDVRCGYCKRLDPVLTRVIADDRNIRRVYKDLPILGPSSVLGAKAALAARKQNGYEQMRLALMKASDISMATIQADARRLGLDWDRLARDMEDPAIRAQIDSNLALAQVLGVRGTPAMVIGEELVPGAIPAGELQRLIAAARASRS